MKKLLVAATLLLVVALVLISCSGANPGGQATPTVILQPVKASNTIAAEGKVVPVKYATLSMAASGTAAEIPVKEGDHVDANQVLVRLDSAQQQAAVATAQAAISHAQAARQKLFQGPDENQLTAARSDLANAKSTLDQAQAAYDQSGGSANPFVAMLPTSVQLQQASISYNAAKARLDTLLAPPKPADVAAADADIAAAKADLAKAQAVLTDTELHAPFAGTLATVDAKVGEQVAAGVPIIRLADMSAWEIQTTDLTEINIARVQVSDTVTMTFDAVPDLNLKGQVSNINSLGTNRQGDIVYTVTVKPDTMDDRLRWNMTAKVNITPSK